jgi:hypothetical protein
MGSSSASVIAAVLTRLPLVVLYLLYPLLDAWLRAGHGRCTFDACALTCRVSWQLHFAAETLQ